MPSNTIDNSACEMLFKLHIYVMFVCFVSSRTDSNFSPTNLLTTRVGPCPDVGNTVVSVSEMSLSTRLHDSSLSGEVNISRNIEDGWTVKALMQKCQDIRNLDTCDYLKSFPVIKDGCNHNDADRVEFYTLLFNRSRPSISCPIKAGIYNITDYPIFNQDNYLAVSEAKISTSIFGYTFRLEGFSKSIKMFCIEAYLQLVYIREHNFDHFRDVTTDEPFSEEERVGSDEK